MYYGWDAVFTIDVRAGPENPIPDFVLEVLSEGTRANDLDNKVTMYNLAGLQEYLIFDPTYEYLKEGMRGWQRDAQGEWVTWVPVPAADGQQVWESRILGLALRPEGMIVRFDHPERGRLPLWSEAQEMLAALERQRNAESQRADAETQRADEERQRADAETQRADAEAEARRQVEEELARLRAELERRNAQG